MISYYFLIASLLAIPISLQLIYAEWSEHHYNPHYIKADAIGLYLITGCFLSFFWPAVIAVLSIAYLTKTVLIWYERVRKSRGA